MSSVDRVLEDAGFSAFARLLRASSFDGQIESGGAFTIFAPTDQAFAKAPHTAIDHLVEGDPDELRAIAGYHFALGKVLSKRFTGKRIRAVTYGGQSLVIDGRSGLHVNAANLVRPDIVAGACIIHGIDDVLWPREAAAAAL
ncbi:MAG: fasciclin domain-containing protein [Pseudomonadota bacterium]